ncbi:hypothetical protein [Occallatibacter riparius]|uniref:Uncharacterized protein n=1 Tax=Occallatibacter riparius TaxID=1002689 RepID=A0A9J7BQ77_9BACT|nr:hypothetical protein [Occallatibacter riparius]UWZ83898.1 hypothetical protein MOP44_25490 [Occallatibacter riparius]
MRIECEVVPRIAMKPMLMALLCAMLPSLVVMCQGTPDSRMPQARSASTAAMPREVGPELARDAVVHPPCWASPPDRAELKTALHARTAVPAQVTIPTGTKITLRILERLASDTAKNGSTVRFVLAKDVIVDGITVLPAGVPVIGIVSRAKPGIAYQQWPELVVRVRKMKIGKESIHLTRTDPNRRKGPVNGKDVATCLMMPLYCMAGAFGMTEDVPTKPNAESGIQGEITPCEIWYFWVKSSVMVSSREIGENRSAEPSMSPTECSRILENPSCDYSEVR